jgi:capsule biosynthesis phosphatase
VKICIDLDGTVCALRRAGETYADVLPLPGAVEKIRALKAAGHYLILLTARHMGTCAANVGLVVARQGKTLFDWLEKHGLVFDEVHFGKPHADVYLDDNALRFESWESIAGDGSSFPLRKEKQKAAEER